MKYGYTIFYVENVKETITFYEKAFGFQQKFITPVNDYGELLSGETTIAFASLTLGNTNLRNGYIPSISSQKSNDESYKPFGVEMAFVIEDIEVDFKKAIDVGAIEYEPIVEKPWGQKVGYLRDNNGFLIEICTPIKKETANSVCEIYQLYTR